MKPGVRRAVFAALLATLAAGAVALWRWPFLVPDRGALSGVGPGRPPEAAAVARLERIPLYRTLIRANALRAGHIGDDGVLQVELDLRAFLEPRLAASGLPGASALFPAAARGTIAIENVAGNPPTVALKESWSLEGPAALLDLLDRDVAGANATGALQAIPGTPSALVRLRLKPTTLADPAFGGKALASWRDRAEFAEKLLGRPLRAEIAEDLAGPAVFALYDGSDENEAEAIVAAELRRSDRLAALLDMVFGLGALTERATVRRYRGVSTGSFVSNVGGSGLAVAVDGPIFILATSRARLESAIDARRGGPHPQGLVVPTGEPAASWTAVSASPFVRHGWARLARSGDEAGVRPVPTTTAALLPEGGSGWRLEGRGPAPAITADPVLPFFRSVFGGRQREGG